jgi:hypothetical protein
LAANCYGGRQLCPFSKAAYPGLKQLASYYDPQDLRVALVLFPLPYHQHAFVAAESVFAITSLLGEDKFTPWAEVVYEHQERCVHHLHPHR